MPTVDETKEVLDMIEVVLADEEGCDMLIPMAMMEATSDTNMNLLFRMKSTPQRFKNMLLQILGRLRQRFNPATVEDPEEMFNHYRDNYAVGTLEGQGWKMQVLQRATYHAQPSACLAVLPASQVATKQASERAVGEIIKFILHRDSPEAALGAIDKFTQVAKYSKWARGAGVVLTIGFMGYDFYINIKNWREGRIDGSACTRNISSSIAACAGGFAAGTAVGAIAGPAGAILGGIAGGLIAAELTGTLFDFFCGDDRKRAADNSYAELGLTPTATNDEVRSAYLRLAKEHHPDKGGRMDKFIVINAAYEMIRAERMPEAAGRD